MNEYTVCMKVLEYQSLHLSSYQHIWVEPFRLFFPSYLCLLSVCLPAWHSAYALSLGFQLHPFMFWAIRLSACFMPLTACMSRCTGVNCPKYWGQNLDHQQ